MNTMDHAQVMEALEKYVVFNYFEKLVNAQVHKIVLFPIFPHTAAANLSDPHYYIIIDDLSEITKLNCGKYEN
ncbi:MAG: hypothetical protein ACPL4K_03535 [Candidatus Margulisiibacteriota bacterium]